MVMWFLSFGGIFFMPGTELINWKARPEYQMRESQPRQENKDQSE